VAYRYRNLSVTGMGRPLTLLVTPSSGGVVGIACLAPVAHPEEFSSTCEALAGTLRLHGSRALGLGPDPIYAHKLASAISGLRAGESISNALVSAQTSAGQAVLCHKLARIQLTAAASLATSKPGPDAASLNRNLIAALRDAGNGYAAMGDAAAAGKSESYSMARTEVSRELTAIRHQLAALQAIGYRL